MFGAIVKAMTGGDINLKPQNNQGSGLVAGVSDRLGLPPGSLALSPHFKGQIQRYAQLPHSVSRSDAIAATQQSAQLEMNNLYRAQFAKARLKMVRESLKGYQQDANYLKQLMGIDAQLQQTDAQMYKAALTHSFTSDTNAAQVTGWQAAQNEAAGMW